jgi:hypothetical protein
VGILSSSSRKGCRLSHTPRSLRSLIHELLAVEDGAFKLRNFRAASVNGALVHPLATRAPDAGDSGAASSLR